MMKTEKLFLNNTVQRNEDLQLWVSEYAEETGISEKNALRVSLLVEETVGMVQGLLNEFESELWLEGDRKSCTLYLDVLSAAGPAEKNASLTSGDGQGAAPAGFMAKVGELLLCAFRFESDEDVPDTWIDAIPGSLSFGAARAGDAPVLMGQWSLDSYRQALKEKIREGAAEESALDELEKSIVASIADDVTIGIRDHRVRLVITKTF